MKRLLFLPLLSLAACASDGAAPATYNQMAPAPVVRLPPRPPSYSPTRAVPSTTPMPGYIGVPEDAPRGTDKRWLPPTKESGIWASDAANDDNTKHALKIANVELELMGIEPDSSSAVVANMCHRVVRRVLGREAQFMAYLMGHSDATRACATSAMLLECLEFELAKHELGRDVAIRNGEEALSFFEYKRMSLAHARLAALHENIRRCKEPADRAVSGELARKWSAKVSPKDRENDNE